MKNLIVLIICFLFSLNCYSCICPTLSKLSRNQIEVSSIGIKGKVIDVLKVDSLGVYRIEMEIKKSYIQDRNKKNQHIILTTPIMSGMCRVRMDVGEEWFVFLQNGEKHITECDRIMNIKKIKKNMNKWSTSSDLRKLYRDSYKMFKLDRKLLMETSKKKSE